MNKFYRILGILSFSLVVLAVTCCEPKQVEVADGARPGDIIPAPVEYSVQPGSIRTDELMQMPEKVRISGRALRHRLKGRDLTDWQLKSAYRLKVGKKGVKIEAADPEGVFYARQSLKMLSSLDSSVTCCTILDWPRSGRTSSALLGRVTTLSKLPSPTTGLTGS